MPEARLSVAPDCPVCGSPSTLVHARLDAVARMARALGVEPAPGLQEAAPGLARCSRCGLEFAHPMREPGAGFYRFLVQSGFDYPRGRWEWRACQQRLARHGASGRSDLVVVDLGSGDGGFMRLVGGMPGVRIAGLDHNPDVVARCRAEGLDVIEGGLEDVSLRWPAGVDMVTFWHVVEHVEDPVGLLDASRRCLREGGELCFSVPLTPMSYEHAWPDPFNEPPHHLTRWNLRSLEALADRLGMYMELDLPPAASLPVRVLRALALQAMPPFGVRGRLAKALRLAGFLLRRPLALPREIARQWHHPRHEGRCLPDVALVILRAP